MFYLFIITSDYHVLSHSHISGCLDYISLFVITTNAMSNYQLYTHSFGHLFQYLEYLTYLKCDCWIISYEYFTDTERIMVRVSISLHVYEHQCY